MVAISERSLEETIEVSLLRGGPDDPSAAKGGVHYPSGTYEEFVPGGYRKRKPDEYDRILCLVSSDVLDFIYATQPKEWEKLKRQHGTEVKDRFLKWLSSEIKQRGVLDVLRRGIKDSGCKFQLAYFRPSSGLNETLEKLNNANLFSVVPQLRDSEKNEKSLDLVMFLNGIPFFTAELKNPFTGQNVEDAIQHYRFQRDPKEPLLVFLPFNQGKFGGPGNPPGSPTDGGSATEYLWNEVWTKDSVLNLMQQFIQEIEIEDEKRRKTGERQIIFPRFRQLDAVRRLVSHARGHGAGESYLIQHSAGSGKSNSIAWLAHQLSVLHDGDDKRVFDSMVVITDRKVLDRQLQRTVRQFEQTAGVVENIDTTSRQLKQALESGKTIIVTTLQKFPVIVKEIGELPGKRFAVIVDEAHSSQSGRAPSTSSPFHHPEVWKRRKRKRPGQKRRKRSSTARFSRRWKSGAGSPT